MKHKICVGLISILFIGCGNDDNPPNYSNEPYIKFVDAFIVYSDEGHQDSLVIKIWYQDGDGDLGLTGEHSNYPPYHKATYYERDLPYAAVYDLESFDGELLRIGDKPGGLDTLPKYNCKDYQIVERPNQTSNNLDTIYRVINEDNKNFLMEIFLQKESGFEFFDLFEETCVSPSGRFDPENRPGSPFTIYKESPWEGTITYVFRGLNLNRLFKDSDAIKLQVKIKDRALNTSNMVESWDISLNK